MQIMAFGDVADSFSWGKVLWNLRNEEFHCDVVLKGKEPDAVGIRAHRVILGARSPYFEAMFGCDMKEAHQSHVQLHNISNTTLSMLVQYLYTSEVLMDEANVVSLLEAALFMDVQCLAEACWNFLHRLDKSLLLYYLAELHQCSDWAEKGKLQALRHFSIVAQSVEFLQLEKSQVMSLIGNDNISVECEDVVWDAVFSWIRHEPDERTPMLAELMAMVRLKHVTPDHLQRSVAEFTGQVGHRDAELTDRIQELIQAGLSMDRQPRESCEFSQVFLGFYRQMYCIDPRSGAVTMLGGMPEGFAASGAAVLGHYVFVLGNLLGSPVLRRYDLELRRWDVLPGPQSSHSEGVVVALAARIYALGGRDGDQTITGTMECFNPETNLWQLVANLPTPRLMFGFVVYQDSLIVIGGLGALGSKSVLRYDPGTDVWTECCKMPVKRSHCTACVGLDNMVYVLGGGKTIEETVYMDVYNPDTNEWFQRGVLPTSGLGVAMGAVDDRVYVLGAVDSVKYNNVVHQGYPGTTDIQSYNWVTRTWSNRPVWWPRSFFRAFDGSVCVLVKLRKEIQRECRKSPEMEATGPPAKKQKT